MIAGNAESPGDLVGVWLVCGLSQKVKGGTWDFAFLMSSQVLGLLLPWVPQKRRSPRPRDSNSPGIGRGWEDALTPTAPGDGYNHGNLQNSVLLQDLRAARDRSVQRVTVACSVLQEGESS